MKIFQKNVVILGGGISGLGIGSKLSKNFDINIIEKNSFYGGLCSSFRYKDCILDLGPHKLYSQLHGIMDEFKNILKGECLTIKKKNSLRIMGKFFKFPINPMQIVKNIDIKLLSKGLKCAFSYTYSLIKSPFSSLKNTTYESYFINGFGKQGYNLLFKDLAWKVWGNPKELTEELGRKRVPTPSIGNLIKSTLSKSKEKQVSAEYFYYPKKGIGVVCDTLLKDTRKNKGKIALRSIPTSINLKKNKVKSLTYLQKGKKKNKKADFLISTIPLIDLVKLLNPKPPKEILNAAESLKYRALILVYLVINKPDIMEDVWAFFLDKEVMFNRVSEQKKFSKFTVPKDKSILMVDLTAEKGDNIWKRPDKELINKVVNDLKKVKILEDEKIANSFVKRVEKAYPVLSVDYKKHVNKILDYVDQIPNLFTIGRHGMFNYNNMDHCIDMANVVTEHITLGKTKSDWKQKRKYFDSYRIVD